MPDHDDPAALSVLDDPAGDGYRPEALAVLRGMEPSRRDPDDPVGRWVDEFLGLPSAPGGVPGGLREAPGEPIE